MNCDQLQRQLLVARHPEQPNAEAAAHLAQCPACRLWQARLVGIEQQIPRLPVPPSQAKRRLLRHVLAGSAGEWESPRADRVACSPTRDGGTSHSPALPFYHALTLVAAGLLVAVGGWWLLKASPNPHIAQAQRPAPRPDPLFAQLSEGHLRLSQALTPQDRVTEMAQFVDHVHQHTQTLAGLADPATLQVLARLYERLVSDGVVRGAHAVAREQRQTTLGPLAERLARLGDEAERWVHEVPPGSVASIQRIVAAARAGDRQLRTLIHEETP